MMFKYRPGELTERITIKRETLTSDGLGGDDLTVSDVVTVAAKVVPLSGNEREDFNSLSSSHNYRFVIRWRSGATAPLLNDRIEWRGTDFNIRSINDHGPRSMYLEIEAEQGVAQ